MRSSVFRALALLAPVSLCAASGDILLQVDAGAFARVNTPVVFQLPEALQDSGHFTLTELGGNKAVDVEADRGRLVWIIRNRLPAGRARRYRLSPASGNHGAPDTVAVTDNGNRLLITVGNRTVLQYNEAVVTPADPLKQEYRRSGYLHPVYDPGGRPITDDMAPDHMHQHGVMFAYEKATFEGRQVNFWEPANGAIEHEAISEDLTSEGKTRKDGNQTRPRWVDLYGQIEGRVSGVAIMDHPSNLQFPQPVRLHPEKPYFCFAPMALGAFRIEPVKPLISRYRFYVHTGQPEIQEIEVAWRNYAYPPEVRIINQ